MKKLTNSGQLEVGEQYRFIITYTGSNAIDEDWLSCDIVVEIVSTDSMISINTMLTNNSYYWPIGEDKFQLIGMLIEHNIEFQKL